MRLYIHWPFCISRCAYCDFNTRTNAGRHMRDYMGALLAELDLWSFFLHEEERRLDSIYLGGGTPSTLSGSEISQLLEEVRARYELPQGSEVTVEVNPATWRVEDFAAARAGGVNRISIGVQSLHDPTLRMLGRAHDAAAASEAIRSAQFSGIASISVDMIYGLPGVGRAMLLDSLQRILAMGPQHVSLYALTLSEMSPLFRAIQKGGTGFPVEDEVADEYLAACALLDESGFEHYEISNFCLPGHHSRHNLGYWKREEYLGVGAGAHSFLADCRFCNTPSLLAYMRAMAEGRTAQGGCEYLDAAGEREEQVMLGLRTSLGVLESSLDAAGDRITDLEGLGLLRRERGRVSLTRRGMLVSNALLCELLPA